MQPPSGDTEVVGLHPAAAQSHKLRGKSFIVADTIAEGEGSAKKLDAGIRPVRRGWHRPKVVGLRGVDHGVGSRGLRLDGHGCPRACLRDVAHIVDQLVERAAVQQNKAFRLGGVSNRCHYAERQRGHYRRCDVYDYRPSPLGPTFHRQGPEVPLRDLQHPGRPIALRLVLPPRRRAWNDPLPCVNRYKYRRTSTTGSGVSTFSLEKAAAKAGRTWTSWCSIAR